MTAVIQDLLNALSLGSLYALFALSVALIFGVGRVANFANGELLTVAAYAVVFCASLSWPLVVLIACVGSVVVALGMERFAFRPVRSASPTTLLIVSFAISALLQNTLLLSASGQAKTTSFGSTLTSPVRIGSVTTTGITLLTIGVTLVVVIALTIVLRRTIIGLKLRAASEDFLMSRLLGVRANTVMATVFAIGGLLAGVAGVMLTIQVGTVTPTFGVQPVTVAFIAAVIGGLGSLVGAALGGLLVGGATVALQVLLPVSLQPYRDAFVFAAVIMLLLVRPQGLLAPTSGERI